MIEKLTLGIETSCDETAAAVFSSERGLLSSFLYSQLAHEHYGGVVPEIASRAHLEKINEVITAALAQAAVSLQDITTIAVTNKPGLPGSLLIGVCFAKALALALPCNIIGINHLEGHAYSAFLEKELPFPHLCLTASGGHTALYLIHDLGHYEILGQTLDDAAGEAFDKIAKVLGLAYPGGPMIEQRAEKVNFRDFFNYPRGNKSINFSFSGLKTAILYDLVKRSLYDLTTKQLSPTITDEFINQVASSMLVCIGDIFIEKLKLACRLYPQIKALSFVGGVACNKYLKQLLANFAYKQGMLFVSPPARFCTDNAAMIAFVGNYKAQQQKFSDLTLDILT